MGVLSMFSQNGCGLGVDAGGDQIVNCGDCVNVASVTNPVNLAIGNDTTAYTIGSNFCIPIPISATATGLTIDDRWSNIINIGFDFSFFGNTYSQLLIGDNGVVTFDIADAGAYCQWNFSDDLPSVNLFGNTIFGAYHDLVTEVAIGGGGNIEYFISGIAPYRQFVITYTAVYQYDWGHDNNGISDCNDLATQQIILQETTNIISVNLINKPALCDNWNNANGVVGIQNTSGTIAYSPIGRQTSDSSWGATNEVWQFLPLNPIAANVVFNGWYDSANILVGNTESITVCPSDDETYTAQYTCTNCDINPITVTDSVFVDVINNLDTDGDGVCNNIDIDDDNDNDGILDSDEALNCNTVPSAVFGSAQGPYSENGSDINNPQIGDSFRFNNVYSGVDAIVTFDTGVGTTIDNIDLIAGTLNDNFQPVFTYVNAFAYVDISIEFVLNSTTTLVDLTTYFVTVYDNDYIEIVGFDDTLDTPSHQNNYSGFGAPYTGCFFQADGTPWNADINDTRFQITGIYNQTNIVKYRLSGGIARQAFHSLGFSACYASVNWNNPPSLIAGYDTDGDGIDDYLDLDSDNDGISDLRESRQDTSSVDTNNNGVLDGMEGLINDVDNDGLSDASETQYGSNMGVAPFDTDIDGIPDIIDIDDDNDGIPDIDEGICNPNNFAAGWYNVIPVGTLNQDGYYTDITIPTIILDGSAHDTSIIQTASPTIIGTGLNLTFHTYYYKFTNVNETNLANAIANNDYLEYEFTTPVAISTNTVIDRIGINENPTLFFDNYKISIAFSDNNFLTSTVLLKDYIVLPGDLQILPSITSNPLVANTSYKFRVYLYGEQLVGTEVYYDDFYFGVCYSLDTDGDNIYDYLDLDSDNDGIYDIVEAGNGINDTDNDGITDNLVGTNGLDNTLETVIDNGILNYTIPNTDETGDYDFLDIDSDDDGCSDSNEAYANSNADGGSGQYGPGVNPASINSDGTVTSANYQEPADGDTNTVYDFQQDSLILTAITTQPVDQLNIVPGANVTFSSSVSFTGIGTVISFQWQESVNNGTTWNNLSNGVIYSGVNSNTLTLTGVLASMNNNLYRVIISTPSYICDVGLTSNDALLTSCNISAPTSGGNQSECETTPIQTLTATAPVGSYVVWYDASSGGNVVVAPILNTVGTVSYYAESVDDNASTCISVTRTLVSLEIKPAPNTPTSNDQLECITNPIQTLTATAMAPVGSHIVWYDVASGGNVVVNPILNTVGIITYYAESIDNSTNCVSLTRIPVILEIQVIAIAPTGNSPQHFCPNSTLADVNVSSGLTTIWYDANGIELINTTPLANGTIYYAAINDTFCALQLPIQVFIVNNISIPTAATPMQFCTADNSTLSDVAIQVTGVNLIFWDAAVLGNQLPLTTELTDNMQVWVSQGTGICADRLEINVITDCQPEVILTKSAQNAFCRTDSEIEYALTVINTGNVPLTSIQVTDDNADTIVDLIDVINPGNEVELIVIHTLNEIDRLYGVVVNSASVLATAIDVDTNATVEDVSDDVAFDGTDSDPLNDDDPTIVFQDSDCDGVIDINDIDADGDGIPDNVEAQDTVDYIVPNGIVDINGLDTAYGPDGITNPQDTDGDNMLDYTDTDSDNDNILDNVEGHDYNHDGYPENIPEGIDTDNDGLDDGYEGSDVNDSYDVNDEIDEPRDLPDTDDDTNFDGDVDYRDNDDDNDGVLTENEDNDGDGDYTNDDCDEDGTPDYLDDDTCFIEIPDGFSPNNDDVNNVFEVDGLENLYPDFRIEIYDRYGNIVYDYTHNGDKTLEPIWWDGISSGRWTLYKTDKMPVGTYFYILYPNRKGYKSEVGWLYLNK